MTLEDFIKRARLKEEQKIKVVRLDVEGYGELEFVRPSINELMKYQKGIIEGTDVEVNTTDEDLKDKTINSREVNFSAIAKISSEFIYNTCGFCRAKEIRDMYSSTYPFDIPIELFGITECIKIASAVFSEFNGAKQVKEAVEEIKN
jgi:hypothetical protein